MNTTHKLSLVALAISALFLSGCGDAETTIVEQDPIVEDGDDHDHDHDGDHDEGEHPALNPGRLSVLDAASNVLSIYDLESDSMLDTFSLTYENSTLSSSADYRYAVVSNRDNDTVEFIDGGVWREDHVDHLHDYEESPAFSSFSLSGSRPTHLSSHDGQLAVFFDGDADSSQPASVYVITDNNIASESDTIASLDFTQNMHGVAKAIDDILVTTVRRDDSETVSSNPALPDSVGIYHLHDGEYEQEQLFTGECPDLHGAAADDDYLVFGCSDGVLILHGHDEVFESSKIANIDAIGDLRIGTVYAHHDAASFIGVASQHGGGPAILAAIEPDNGEMEQIDWSPEVDASPISYGFSYDGEHFLILDNQGYLSVLSAHAHDDHTHWELEGRVDISDEDISQMPEGTNFSMAVSQNAGTVYVADPMEMHVLVVDLGTLEVSGDIELNFVPSSVSWLGIADTEH